MRSFARSLRPQTAPTTHTTTRPCGRGGKGAAHSPATALTSRSTASWRLPQRSRRRRAASREARGRRRPDAPGEHPHARRSLRAARRRDHRRRGAPGESVPGPRSGTPGTPDAAGKPLVVAASAWKARDMTRTFDELVAEAEAAPVEGWVFSWLDGRAVEERPPGGCQRLMSERLAGVLAAVDMQTGGGEVLAGAERLPPVMVATEGWPPNVAEATRLLHPLGAAVVADADQPPLPFAAEAFDLVVSRHPVTVHWAEIARVLRPGGSYLSQQVGPASVFELVEFFLGPQPEEVRRSRHPEDARRAAEAAGLEVVDLRTAELHTEFRDVGAVVYFLRKVIWMVPGFTVAEHRDRLRDLHARIEAEGPFTATTTRFLIEARKPG